MEDKQEGFLFNHQLLIQQIDLVLDYDPAKYALRDYVFFCSHEDKKDIEILARHRIHEINGVTRSVDDYTYGHNVSDKPDDREA